MLFVFHCTKIIILHLNGSAAAEQMNIKLMSVLSLKTFVLFLLFYFV